MFQSLIPVRNLYLQIAKDITKGSQSTLRYPQEGRARVQLAIVLVLYLNAFLNELEEGIDAVKKCFIANHRELGCVEEHSYCLDSYLPQLDARITFCSCKRELFGAYLHCRQCGYLCLRCALDRCSGCSAHNLSGVVKTGGKNKRIKVIHETSSVVMIFKESPAHLRKLLIQLIECEFGTSPCCSSALTPLNVTPPYASAATTITSTTTTTTTTTQIDEKLNFEPSGSNIRMFRFWSLSAPISAQSLTPPQNRPRSLEDVAVGGGLLGTGSVGGDLQGTSSVGCDLQGTSNVQGSHRSKDSPLQTDFQAPKTSIEPSILAFILSSTAPSSESHEQEHVETASVATSFAQKECHSTDSLRSGLVHLHSFSTSDCTLSETNACSIIMNENSSPSVLVSAPVNDNTPPCGVQTLLQTAVVKIIIREILEENYRRKL